MTHINPKAGRKKSARDPQELVKQLRGGSISALARAITIVESTAAEDAEISAQILQLALPYSGNSFRLGITGVPGVGKSTFIESLGNHAIQRNLKVAVLAIDPTSGITRGSILGDKTRMEELVKSDQAFIRPSPAGDTLGGVARKTREAILLCEAAGFDMIIVETVGVGQSETAVHGMTDFFLLLKLAGAGDNLQGIKRGIMEMADAVIINKADGDNQPAAKRARQEFSNALHMLPPKDHKWPTQVMTCSGLNDRGVVEVLDHVMDYKKEAVRTGYFNSKRKKQELHWLRQTINEQLKDLFYHHPEVEKNYPAIEQRVLDKELTPYQGAEELLEMIRLAGA